MTAPIAQTLPVSRGPYGLHAELVPGPGVPVVLMHGFPDSTHLYDRLVPHLAGRRPVVRFDFLGWARSVSDERGPMSSVSSLKVATAQSGSGHRQIRLRHTSTTGRSAMGRSRIFTTLRPWPTARVPQAGQPVTLAVVSTSIHSSRSCSIWVPTTNSGMPSSVVLPRYGGSPSRASSSAVGTTAEWRGPWPRWGTL